MERLPRFTLAWGCRKCLGQELVALGIHGPLVLVLSPSVQKAPWFSQWAEIQDILGSSEVFTLGSEPSVSDIDSMVITVRARAREFGGVLAIGGGSVMDAAKALAAMLTEEPGFSVSTFLERPGAVSPHGTTLPLIVVPTIPGTGAENTWNAVISGVQDGEAFKASLRHPGYLPRSVLMDPELFTTVPWQSLWASSADCLVQLLESYFSTKATGAIQSMVLSVLGQVVPALNCIHLGSSGSTNPQDLRDAFWTLGLASWISGFALARAGLGTVHGLVSGLGAATGLKHGYLCARLFPATLKETLQWVHVNHDQESLERLTELGPVLGLEPGHEAQGLIQLAQDVLAMGMDSAQANVPLGRDQLIAIAKGGGNKNSPASLEVEKRLLILEESGFA